MIRVGDEAETIASITEEGGFDVIMLPMMPRSFRSVAFEESLPAKVMEKAKTAVWTVESSYSLSPYLPYFCAFDFYPVGSLDSQNKRIVETAKLVSQTLHTKLTLIHVITEDDMQDVES